MARGTLRIYLGAAPGVGKTFAMLDEGRRRRDRGTDVVVGVVETHGRETTAAQIGDLEVVPRRTVEYRGSTFEEMDVDAVLAAGRGSRSSTSWRTRTCPDPGTRSAGRTSTSCSTPGSTVISTLNIQHLESLNDVVERITGIAQRETIPDEIVRRADQIELVDMSPEALRRRMAHGNIYPAERIDAALGNYFRVGNLGALRELALLWVADRVEEALDAYRRDQGIERPWETRERVVVALTGAEDDDRLVRRAGRMAQRVKGDLIAVHVRRRTASPRLRPRARPSAGARGASRRQLPRGRGRGGRAGARRRGAQRQRDPDRARRDASLALAGAHPWLRDQRRDSGLGRRRRRPRDQPRARRGATRAAAPAHRAAETPDRRRGRPGGRPPPRAHGRPGHLRDDLGLPSVLLLYILAVVAVSAVGGVWPALGAAVVAFLLANWYFTPPLYTFTIGETENLLALTVFLLVAGTVSGFVSLAARRAAEGKRARADAETFARLAGTTSVDELLESIRRVFALDGVTLWHRAGETWTPEGVAGGEVARDGSVLRVDAAHELALAGRDVPGDEQRLLDAFVAELASSIHIDELTAEASEAVELERANDLRVAILSAVSHDLRTPLSGIKASVTSLLDDEIDWPESERDAFLATIDEETDRLDGLVGNLLDMSRLQTGALQIDASPIGLDEVVPAALRSLGSRADAVDVDVPETLPRVQADPGLLERAIANVVANALAHGGGAPVRVVAGSAGDRVDLRVVDRGPGVPHDQHEGMFVPFQRLGDSASIEGVGLGLAVARGFIEAMGGVVEVEDTPAGGLTLIFRLEAAR